MNIALLAKPGTTHQPGYRAASQRDPVEAGSCPVGHAEQDRPGGSAAADRDGRALGVSRSADARMAGATRVRSWPLLVLALPAAVAVWSGWVGIGRMTGFGLVHPLPGIWNSCHLDTAITLPIGMEAYAAYALRAFLAPAALISRRTRRFAGWSAAGALVLGMAGQVAYHLLAQQGVARAPWEITLGVSCLPVLVLGMGAALAHLLHADAHAHPGPGRAADAVPAAGAHPARPSGSDIKLDSQLPAETRAAGLRVVASGRRISRRTLRAAGLCGSNADLGHVAAALRTELIPVTDRY